jgi:hypothetical protein
MTQKTWTLDQIEVNVSGFFTTHHHFRTEMGALGKFTFPAFGQHGVFRTADGRELTMEKTHWLGSAHQLVEGNVVRATADLPGLLRQDYAIQFEGQDYVLEPEGIFKMGWVLADAAGTTLLEIQPRGVLKQGAYLTIWAKVDADLVAFAYYLVHMRKQEQAAAVAATSSAAAAS